MFEQVPSGGMRSNVCAHAGTLAAAQSPHVSLRSNSEVQSISADVGRVIIETEISCSSGFRDRRPVGTDFLSIWTQQYYQQILHEMTK